MIMWDPETYPDVQTIADLGKTDALVRYFGGAAYMDFLTGSGILKPEQVDGSYSGDPSLFIADEGKAAQQGFGSAEPYLYENVITSWLKPVKYQYINDVGWENYAESIATKPENITEYADCFKELVPIIQQSSVDYLNDPARATAIILDAVQGSTRLRLGVRPGRRRTTPSRRSRMTAWWPMAPTASIGKLRHASASPTSSRKAVPIYTAQDSRRRKG